VSGKFAAVTGLRGSLGVVHREIAKFGAVGAIAFVVNVGLFNLLSAGPLDGHEKLSLTIASGVSIVVAWFGSRYWTFRHREQNGLGREYFLFFLLNGIALLFGMLTIGFTTYTLDRHDALSVNIANIVGVGLGTLFRYWSYKKWVFLEATEPIPVELPEAGVKQDR
jgi:putative flippase GtrA